MCIRDSLKAQLGAAEAVGPESLYILIVGEGGVLSHQPVGAGSGTDHGPGIVDVYNRQL